MKLTTKSLYIQLVAIVMALTFVARVQAATPREELVHAYILLKQADHDYAGHRAIAMGEVEAAGKSLGLHLEGDGVEKERQWKSDAKVAEARKILRAARNKLEAADRERAAAHLDKAIEELNLALKVK